MRLGKKILKVLSLKKTHTKTGNHAPTLQVTHLKLFDYKLLETERD